MNKHLKRLFVDTVKLHPDNAVEIMVENEKEIGELKVKNLEMQEKLDKMVNLFKSMRVSRIGADGTHIACTKPGCKCYDSYHNAGDILLRVNYTKSREVDEIFKIIDQEKGND